jgi:hypothetical protein
MLAASVPKLSEDGDEKKKEEQPNNLFDILGKKTKK